MQSNDAHPIHRILVIDDNPDIHEDFKKILCPAKPPSDLAEDEAAIFGGNAPIQAVPTFPAMPRAEPTTHHVGVVA